LSGERAWGIFRELAHSPGRETDDALILQRVAGGLVEARPPGLTLPGAARSWSDRMTAGMRESVAGPRSQELRLTVVTPSAVPAATLFVSAPARDGVAPTTPLLGLPLARRVALAAFRAGFVRVLFEAASGSDLSGALRGTGAEVVPPGGPFPEIPPGRLVLLAPGVIPQAAWLKSLLARPVESGVFLLDAADETVALVDSARGREVLAALAARAPGGAWEAATAGSPARAPLSSPAQAIVVRGRLDLPRAERWLLQSLVKETDGFFTRHFERPISLSITRRLVATRVSPNAMTILSVGVGLAGAALFLSSAAPFQFAGALLFVLQSILDDCDGELARVRFQESRFGGVLDFWGDNVVHSAVFGCLAVGWSRATGDPWPLLAGAAAIAGTLLSAGFVFRYAMGGAREGPQFTSVTSAPAGRLSRMADMLARRDFIYLVVLLSAFGKARWFLALGAFGAPLFFVLLVAMEASGRRRGRNLS
jgi:1L-myo-inositol 1-phosphate cytidylyltransferase / CDP-L-myo-inositol myo-inositolphosphotransferase